MAPALILLLAVPALGQQAVPVLGQQAAPIFPQQPKPILPQQSAESPVVFRAGVALVKVDVQVVDRNGLVAPGLRAADFRVFDDGQPRPIAYFGQESEPLDLVLLLDVSGSMHPHLERMAATARAALTQLYPSDRVGVMLFAKRAEVREPLTQDLRAVEDEMRDAVDTQSLGSGTAINVAVVAAAQYLQKEPVRGRRAVLIVTDNVSLNYQLPDDEVVRQLYAADAVLNGIVIGKLKRPDPPKAGHYVNADFTPSDVFKLAEESGGEAIEAGRIGESFQHMIERIRARYTLQFEAPASPPGAFHRIRVELTAEARAHRHVATIRARAGYYAAK